MREITSENVPDTLLYTLIGTRNSRLLEDELERPAAARSEPAEGRLTELRFDEPDIRDVPITSV